MKVWIKLKSTALQKLALVKTIKDHTGYGLTEAKLAVDDLHQMSSFLVSLDILGLEYESSTVEHERERKMMELGLAEREEYISFLSGENQFHQVDTGKVARMALEGMGLEEIKDIFDRINSGM